MTDKEKYYKYRQENVLAIEEGLGFVMGNIKSGIIQEHKAISTVERKKAKRYVLIQSRILSGLIVSWSEEIIKRLFYEPNAFSETQIQKLHELNLQQKWEFALKAAFCKAYNVRNPNGTPLFIGVDIYFAPIGFVQIRFSTCLLPSSPPSAAMRGRGTWGLRPQTPVCTKPIGVKYRKPNQCK